MKKLMMITLVLLSLNIMAQEMVVEATHVSATTQIIWKWHPIEDATGYSIGPSFESTTDVGADTLFVATTLTPNTIYTTYVWAYNACGHGSPTELTSATLDDFVCGNTKTITHTAGVVAPVTKTVTYGTVDSVPGELSKCWITSNLGSTHQATAKNDTTEASAGWYWQFNRKQGYKYAGTIRTPNTTWVASIDEYSDWLAANDPCTSELGIGWRLPTAVEWTNVDAGGSWTTLTAVWNSPLKLHAAGWLDPANGSISMRGSYGGCWSSSQTNNTTLGQGLFFYGSASGVSMYQKTTGYSIRCIKDSIQTGGGGEPTIPTVTTTSVSNISQTTATGGGNVTSSGGFTLITKGICWNTSTTPTISNSYTTEGTDIGVFTSNLTGLTANILYYVRAYATNSIGTAYGNQVTFTTSQAWSCGDAIVKNHTAGTVAPVSKTVTYGTIDSIPGELSKCWITSNLGSTHQATAKNDATEASAGWYWQFNRKRGFKHTGTVRAPSTTWVTPITANSSWTATNDPCTIELGGDWRIPTSTEWTNIDAAGSWTTPDGPWNSALKIHAAGRLTDSTGALSYRGTHGYYWASTQSSTTNGWRLHLYTGYCGMGGSAKANAFTLRCIK